MQKAIPNRLDKQVLTAEMAQDQIRLAVKDALFMQGNKRDLDKKVFRIIQLAISQIRIPSLKDAVYRSLTAYYYRQRQIAAQISPAKLYVFLCLLRLAESGVKADERSPYTAKITVTEARKAVGKVFDLEMPERDDSVINLGSPLRKYHREYYKDNILPTIDKMSREEALDPDSEKYWEKRATIRNRAEREVRWQGHIDNRADLEAKGVKLVIVSAHADCSDRCRPWQGRVYSLDGTSGKTPDGRSYVPLETATDIYTPDGKWKNGLFGFNCRHYMVAYKNGYSFPKPSAAREEREYKITCKQRYMERQVRHWRTEAEMAKGIDPDRFKLATDKAKYYNNRYKAYSHKHNRPYYDTRTQI